MSGVGYFPRNTSGAGAVKSWETVELGGCDDLVAKYSNPASGSAKTSSNYNVSLMEETDGVEVIGLDSQYDTYLNTPDLEYALSAETADLIKRATSARKDAAVLLNGNSFSGNTSSHDVKRLLSDARKFEQSLSLEQTMSLKSSQSHTTSSMSNRTLTMNSSDIRARRALEPPESYAPQRYQSKYSVSSRDDFSTPRFSSNSRNSAKSARDLYTSTTSPNSARSFHSGNYSPNSVRFASVYARQPTDSSVKSFRSSSSGTGSVQSRLQDLNARSHCLKAYIEQERNAELSKPDSTWSDIDSRLEYLKKRCTDLSQHTRMTGPSDYNSFSAPSQISAVIQHSRSDCGKSVSHISIQSERTANTKTETSSLSVKPVALKVLSERVLTGYRITRESCEKCGVSKLAKCDRTADGSTPATEHRSECVFCPINDMRSDIQSIISRKIFASKLLMGYPTISRGKQCELCLSPTLVQPNGTVICEVCPVLDAICLEVAREQTKGGRLMNLMPCRVCGAKTVSVDGDIKCVACAVMKEWQQEQQQQKQKQKEKEEATKLIKSPLAAAENATAVPEINKNPSMSETVQSNNDGPKTSIPGQNQENVDDWALAAVKSSEEAKKNGEKPKIFESLMGRCGAVSDGSPTKDAVLNISNLQGQLLRELAKAKQCQLVLENSIEDPTVTNADGTISPSPEELNEELAKAKRCQYALERIIETTSNMEVPSILPNEGEIDDIVSAPELKGTFSISQQEVEAGQPKEYIPPPSFFRSGIPSMVEVTLITPAPDSNMAQAYETNLRNTDNDKKLVSKSRVGIDFWPFTRAGNKGARRQEEEVQGGFDYDTIQTDDFTVDYTLNTMDDSRLEYLRIKSKNTNKVRFQLDEEKEQDAGCSFMDCFACGDDNVTEGRDEDAYASKSRQDKGDIQRENPVSVSPHKDAAVEKNSAFSVASEVSSQVPSNHRPAWIGSGSTGNNSAQEPPAANDYSEISDVSAHIYRGTRRPSNTRGPQMQNRASDYSAVSELSGSINRMHEYMHEIASVTSDNSGSMVQLNDRRTAGAGRRSGRGSSRAPPFHKMAALVEAESIDTSVDKYMVHPSTSGSRSGDLAEMRRIVNGFERSNPASMIR
jgi:uncharacterized Zn finger protein (UPF0148 family)